MNFNIRICALLLFTFISCAVFAQNKEGKISSTTKVLELPEEAKGMESMFNTSMTMYYKGKNVRIEMQTSMGTVIILVDSTKNEVVTCMDVMGQKIALVSTLEEAEGSYGQSEMSFEGGKFELTNETKTIAGHVCKKAIWTGGEEGEDQVKTEIWYATDMADTTGEYEGLPGMAMEYTFSIEEMKMQYQVTELSTQKVDDKLFKVPDGYVRKKASDFVFPGSGKE
jgi:GLPGLI family protein